MSRITSMGTAVLATLMAIAGVALAQAGPGSGAVSCNRTWIATWIDCATGNAGATGKVTGCGGICDCWKRHA